MMKAGERRPSAFNLSRCRTTQTLAGFSRIVVEPVAHELSPGYTVGMKTAISVPDRVFRAAERHARRAKKSRSQLYADALAEYLARHAPDDVTEAMNRVADELDAPLDAFVAAAAVRTLRRSEW